MQVKLKMDFAPGIAVFDYEADINNLYTGIMTKAQEANPYNRNAKYWITVN